MSRLPTRPSPDDLAARDDALRTVYAVLQSSTWRGPWEPPEAMRLLCVLGSVVLDYREADLPPGVTEVDCDVYLGSVEILVPPDVDVEIAGSLILGSVETRGGGRASWGRRLREHLTGDVEPEDTEERPLLSVRCTGALGSVEIRLT